MPETNETSIIKVLIPIAILLLVVIGLIFWLNPFNFKFGTSTASAPESKIPPFNPTTLTWAKVATTSPWATRDSQEVYEFNGKLWLAGGLDANQAPGAGTVNVDYEQAKYFNDIWSTTDGENWTLETEHAAFPPIRSQSITYFKDALYMVGGWSPQNGYQNGIWRSTDGKNWEQFVKTPAFEPREGQKIKVWNGRLYMIGGVNYFSHKTFNDVWVSDDAKTWTEVTAHAPWHSRWDFDMDIYNNKLYLASGMSDITTGYDDVWSTVDGKDWVEEATSTPWGTKQGEGLIVYKNYLWFVGGLLTKENTGDGATWYTSDGANWQKTATNTPALAREDHSVIVWHDKIWVIAGMRNDWHWYNDVWFTK
ncbi:MAG: hypothetical protein NT041_02345 [Candidatus Vogelbacteria bacterium]|nr:hypothetical protein [Candidatus Vogelbacteria bacterium]